jgi:hypothetical protein
VGVPEILALESRMLLRETKLLEYMIDTRSDVEAMNLGPSGYIFPN